MLVTHSALDALVLADRVVVLTDGRVVEQGPTREVLARPRSPFTARIAGLNLVPGRRCPDGPAHGRRARWSPGWPPSVADGRAGGGGVPAVGGGGVPRRAARQPAQRVRRCGWPRSSRAGTWCGCGRPPAPAGRPWVDGLAADVTPAAVADLAVEPGAELWFAVKATEVAIHAANV